MIKSRASQIRDALLLINDILRDNELEIEKDVCSLCIFDKQTNKAYSFPKELPTENLTADQSYFAEQLQEQCESCLKRKQDISYLTGDINESKFDKYAREHQEAIDEHQNLFKAKPCSRCGWFSMCKTCGICLNCQDAMAHDCCSDAEKVLDKTIEKINRRQR